MQAMVLKGAITGVIYSLTMPMVFEGIFEFRVTRPMTIVKMGGLSAVVDMLASTGTGMLLGGG